MALVKFLCSTEFFLFTFVSCDTSDDWMWTPTANCVYSNASTAFQWKTKSAIVNSHDFYFYPSFGFLFCTCTVLLDLLIISDFWVCVSIVWKWKCVILGFKRILVQTEIGKDELRTPDAGKKSACCNTTTWSAWEETVGFLRCFAKHWTLLGCDEENATTRIRWLITKPM